MIGCPFFLLLGATYEERLRSHRNTSAHRVNKSIGKISSIANKLYRQSIA
jgi:hypothetical protein